MNDDFDPIREFEGLRPLLIVGLAFAVLANVIVIVRFGPFLVGNATAVIVCTGAAIFIWRRKPRHREPPER